MSKKTIQQLKKKKKKKNRKYENTKMRNNFSQAKARHSRVAYPKHKPAKSVAATCHPSSTRPSRFWTAPASMTQTRCARPVIATDAMACRTRGSEMRSKSFGEKIKFKNNSKKQQQQLKVKAKPKFKTRDK
jgi:hypothetical protein